ncbi:uncharacterized protein ARMOST_14678 [Armillaria ostoyae]|uniref:Uncharacterized protein n=1 Tax=Armillaria ostoyae TaxID=47428 RepID=A0A284RRF1_ARMOS|nr:uncharacterized protein ARMOST_14678 [Armillaria ostoyae]
MNIDAFSAGYVKLRPLFDMRQYTKLQARDITILLNENHDYLLSLYSSAREHPDVPILLFLLDMVHTCQEITAKLSAYAQSPLFQNWELQLREQSQWSVMDKNTEWLDMVKVTFLQATTRKHRLEKLKAEREESQELRSKETKPPASTSGAASKTPMKLLTTMAAKVTVKAGSQVSAITVNDEEMVEIPIPQRHARATKSKFASAIPIKSEATAFVAILTGSPWKACKTRPGSIKEELNTSKLNQAQLREQATEGDVPFQIKIKQKNFTALSTHIYKEKALKPVTVEETQALTEVSTKDALANEGAKMLKGVVFEEPFYSLLEAFRPTPGLFLPVEPAPSLSDQDHFISTSPADTFLIHHELTNDSNVPNSAEGSNHEEKSGLPPNVNYDRFIIEDTPDQDPDQDELPLFSPRPDQFSSPIDKSEAGSPNRCLKSQKKAEKKAAKHYYAAALLQKMLGKDNVI